MPPLIGTTGAASSKGFGQFALTSLGPQSWIAYLGQQGAPGSMIENYGFFVDALSNSYWPYYTGTTNSYGIGKLDSTGTLSTYTQPFFENRIEVTAGSTRYSSAIVPVTSAGPYPYSSSCSPMLLGSTLNKLFTNYRYPNGLGGPGNNYPYYRSSAVTSTSELVVAGNIDLGKIGFGQFYARYGSNGLPVTVKGSGAIAYVPPCVCLRTDDSVQLVYKDTSFIKIHVFDTSNTYVNTKRYSYAGTDANQDQDAVTDSSNNIYVASTSGYIYRINSSYTMTHVRQISSISSPSICEYNGYLYVMYTKTGVGTSGVYITCMLSSDLTVQWTNRYDIGTTATNIYKANNYASIYATADGVFTVWRTTTSPGAQFIMKTPLTGITGTGSKVLSGAGYTLTWSIVSTSTTSYSTTNLAIENYSWGGNSVGVSNQYGINSIIPPTATRTTF